MRCALFNMDDEDEEDEDGEFDDSVECAGGQDDEEDDYEVGDEREKHDALLRPFGLFELSPEAGIVGWQWINDLLTCIRNRIEEPQGEGIRSLRAKIESLRCDSARDLAAHAMASAVAEYALGEHEGLAARVDNARAMHDDAFMAVGAMMIAIGTGELTAARALARDAVSRYPNDATVLRQAGYVYQAVCEFREAIEVLSTLFDIAERSGASWHQKMNLASEIEEIGEFLERAEERGVDEPVFAQAIELAVSLAREQGHKILGVDVRSLGEESEGIEIQIDALTDKRRPLYHALVKEYRHRCGDEAYRLLLFTYESYHFQSVSTVADTDKGGL